MGRPKKENKLSKVICLRLDEEMHENLKMDAEHSTQSMQDFLRMYLEYGRKHYADDMLNRRK